ncbi:helix-turn-helix domain-containing protein [Actinacidiphila oryziradicis]|uniref:helix-turn-helix domain-containing protein n=1 Tax=Actinacidiphila oryziradicis TaxID=2571141 RepID=UPI00145CDEEC|nr:helix-turn-helix transcriptional regulator [Actinacidiphila oryziradicis]
MTAVQGFGRYLVQLHARAGAPSRRDLAGRTGFGKSTISDAFAGRRLPTWPVAEALVAALGGEVLEARERWGAAKAGSSRAQEPPGWLTSVRSDIPELMVSTDFIKACAAAPGDPKKALAASWEALRLSAGQLTRARYKVVPGNWSSDIVATFRRAEDDGLLPAGVTAVADAVHRYHVDNQFPDHEPSPTAEVLQVVFLAFRLAWQARDVVVSARA